jgi:aromatic ring-opening dioxygenase catalytic subunit (LigB family)
MHNPAQQRPLPAFFLPHGAGPCFFMNWEPPTMWHRLGTWLQQWGEIHRAATQGIVVFSAHWEEPVFTLNTALQPGLLFDYHGFPEATYRLQWPAMGAPWLIERSLGLLQAHGIAHATRSDRGLDHGVFIPLLRAFPQAELPVLQISLKKGLDPGEHLALGRALSALRAEGVLLVGSGMAFHNMRRFRLQGGPPDADSVQFDAWLTAAVAETGERRAQQLQHWQAAPCGRASHPREEHLLPLHVVAGSAWEETGRVAFRDQVIGSVQSAFAFGSG